MTIKELKEILSNASDNDNIEVVNNKIVFIKDKSQDITDRIKTFDDAVEWCKENGKREQTDFCESVKYDFADDEDYRDIIAYLKLRIITTALNEGWEPTEEKDESVYVPKFDDGIVQSMLTKVGLFGDSALKLAFKTRDLADYAATQFADIYADYCGCRKGGEE